MRWILDDGPLDILARLDELPDLPSYPAGELCVAPTTAEAAKRSPSRSRLLDVRAINGRRIFHKFEILMSDDDPAANISLELRGGERASLGAAECEAIAWAAVHAEDAVFVTADKQAAVTALAELGRSRVAHAFDLWIELLSGSAVSRAGFKHLCEHSKRKDQLLWRMPDRITRYFHPSLDSG